MRSKLSRLVLLVLASGIAACGSAPALKESGQPIAHFDPGKDPYWEDPRWDQKLLDSVQAAVRDPADASDMSAPGLHATVKFTYLQGTLEYPEIIAGTGNPDLDKLMLHQLASVQVPQPTSGLQTDTPHEFVLDLDMPTPYESFLSGVYQAIDAAKVYPKEPIIQGIGGIAKLDFDYLDGKASGVTITASSNRKDLDQASIKAVTMAAMPSAPAEYASKSLHLEVVFCYFIGGYADPVPKNPCPAGRDVIVVHGFRIRR